MSPPGGRRLAFTLLACLLLLPLKLIRGWNAEPPLSLLSAWLLDACFLLGLCLLSIAAGGRTPRRRLVLGGGVFLLLQIPALLVIAAHTYYLEEATARQFSLLDSSFDAIAFFVTEIVPPAVLIVTGLLLSGLVVAARFLARRLWLPRPRWVALAAGGLCLIPLVHQATVTFYPSVLWEMGRDVAEALSHPAVAPGGETAELAKAEQGRLVPEGTPRFERVLLFVMESVPSRTLEQDAAALPAGHFFNLHRTQAHRYSAYFTTNQDSRTGLLAMLFGRLIPFEAYSERDARQYLFLRQRPSLVDRMAAAGFHTAVAAAQTDVELVVFELPWRTRLILSQAEFENHGDFLCFNPYQFEHDCEDRILLPRIYSLLDEQPRLFLMQEAVFGHIGEYEQSSGKTPVQYYGDYLQAVWDRLAERGLLDTTLLVVTSDHGIRDWDYRTRRWALRLPLWFINPRFQGRAVDGLYNQSDFPALLWSELTDAPPPLPRQVSAYVGCTNSSLVGAVSAEGDLLVVKDRRYRKYVLADGFCPDDDRPTAPPRRAVPAGALIEFFRNIRERFEESFQRAADVDAD
ncbi:MAG: hypothetical protein GYA21_20035 [Myxococcales bacterium]|nr:hypothetical protein [Myxococcales bacterium]